MTPNDSYIYKVPNDHAPYMPTSGSQYIKGFRSKVPGAGVVLFTKRDQKIIFEVLIFVKNLDSIKSLSPKIGRLYTEIHHVRGDKFVQS